MVLKLLCPLSTNPRSCESLTASGYSLWWCIFDLPRPKPSVGSWNSVVLVFCYFDLVQLSRDTFSSFAAIYIQSQRTLPQWIQFHQIMIQNNTTVSHIDLTLLWFPLPMVLLLSYTFALEVFVRNLGTSLVTSNKRIKFWTRHLLVLGIKESLKHKTGKRGKKETKIQFDNISISMIAIVDGQID